jgi:hypothetical protein
MFLATQNEDFLEISKANEANTADKTVVSITRIIWIMLKIIIYPNLTKIMRLYLVLFQSGNLHCQVLF